MATNPIVDIFRVKDLRDRILFTIFLLIIFRLGTFLPIPGIDRNVIVSYFSQEAAGGGIIDFLDFFSGGALKNFSIMMLGIMPYITTSIIMQLLTLVFPRLKKLSEEEGGRKKIHRYTRLATVPVCLIQSFAVTRMTNQIPDAITIHPIAFALIAMLTVTTGTIFVMWLGEQITQRGIGNGISIIIFAGIVARIPWAINQMVQVVRDPTQNLNPVYLIVVFAMFVGVVSLVIYEQQGQRKIPVHYAKRVIGRKIYGAQNTYIPFKINPSGVIPVIFASSVLSFPIQIAQSLGGSVPWMQRVASFLNPTGVAYQLFYALLIVFFAYFYTSVTLNPMEIAKNIRENGGSIPGIRSERMEQYLTRILNRIVLPGALFLAFIALIPSIVQSLFNLPPAVAYLMGGTSLLIMVGVDLDTMSQIEGHLRMHHHDGLMKRGRIRSRNL
jgi:preprotein translocase subunit SecY